MKKCRSDIINLFSIFKTAGFFLLLLPFSLAPLISQAAVITVPGDYSTIQAAIDSSVDGDETIVSAGTYYENINFAGKNIILRSTDPTSPTVVANTIIDGSQNGSVVTFSGDGHTYGILDGFTITNGKSATNHFGGGIHCSNSSPEITNCIITNNSGQEPRTKPVHDIFIGGYAQGGGIYCHNSSPEITNCIITNNSADGHNGYFWLGVGSAQATYGKGGGIYCENSSPTLTDCIISENSATGGSYKSDGSFANGSSGNGGGLYFHSSSAVLTNCVINDNVVRGGEGRTRNMYGYGQGGSAKGGGIFVSDSFIKMVNCIVNGNIIRGGDGFHPYPSFPGVLGASGGPAYGGGIYSESSSVTNFNCDMISNSSMGGGGNDEGGDADGGGLYGSFENIINSIIWANSDRQIDSDTIPSYSCIQNWTGSGPGNISEDPQLVDPANGDFHLKPDSPCIDAGCYIPTLAQDFEGDPRPMDGTSQPRGDGSDFDIGADEYPEPTLNPIRNLIRQYYNRILNRAPKISAIDAWEGYFNYTLDFDIGAHFIAADIGRRILLSQEYAYRNRSREEFIRDCYRGFLLRMPSSDEVTAWLNGSWSRDEAISIFINSNEFVNLIISLLPDHEGDSARNFIATMYMGILERLVSGGAVEAWDGWLRDTSDKRGAAKWMARIFFGSDEYTSKSPTNRDRVICLYRGLLGRFPHYGEISYWEGELNSGRKTLEELIDIFCDSEEFTARLIEFFGTAGPSTTENIDHIYEEIEPSPVPSVESPVTRVPDWEYY